MNVIQENIKALDKNESVTVRATKLHLEVWQWDDYLEEETIKIKVPLPRGDSESVKSFAVDCLNGNGFHVREEEILLAA